MKGQQGYGINAEKIVLAILWALFITAFIGAFIQATYKTGIGEYIKKAGEAIYDIYVTLNPSLKVVEEHTYIDHHRLGWAITFVIIMVTTLWLMFVENAYNKLLRGKLELSSQVEATFIVFMTISVIVITLLSPGFSLIVDVALMLLGGGMIVGFALVIGAMFLISFGITLRASFKGFSVFYKTVGRSWLAIPRAVRDVQLTISSERALEEILIDLENELKQARDIHRKIKGLINMVNSLKTTINTYPNVLKSPINRHSLQKFLQEIEGVLSNLEKEISKMIKENLIEEKLVEVVKEKCKEILRIELGLENVPDYILHRLVEQVKRRIIENERVLSSLERRTYDEIQKERLIEEEIRGIYLAISEIRSLIQAGEPERSRQRIIELLNGISEKLNSLAIKVSRIIREIQEDTKFIKELERDLGRDIAIMRDEILELYKKRNFWNINVPRD